jgi:simple sugar transport system permease protein
MMTARVRIEAEAIAVVSALAVAWIAFALLVWLYGESPRLMARLLLEGTWGTAYGAGQVLFKATPLLCTGVAVELGLRAGLFNIGGEGQLAVASVAVAVVGAKVGGLPAFVAIPALVVVAMTAGGAWAFVPALLRARFGAHEVIGTIMMNRIADAGIGALLAAGLAVFGSVRTPDVAPSAHLPRLDVVFASLRGSAVSFALVVAVFLAFAMQWALQRTRVGRELVLVGQNPLACAAARIPVPRRLAAALVLSGACAGLASAGTVLGYKGYYEMGLGAGAGFGGLAVALLGRSSAVGLVLAALFFGTLQQGGLAINAHVPREVMDVLEGVVIVAVSIGDARARRALRGAEEARS